MDKGLLFEDVKNSGSVPKFNTHYICSLNNSFHVQNLNLCIGKILSQAPTSRGHLGSDPSLNTTTISRTLKRSGNKQKKAFPKAQGWSENRHRPRPSHSQVIKGKTPGHIYFLNHRLSLKTEKRHFMRHLLKLCPVIYMAGKNPSLSVKQHKMHSSPHLVYTLLVEPKDQ